MSQVPGKILIIIPARGGSKGIVGKNLKQIHGKSLTEWAMLSALELPFEKRIVLSSDSPEILALTSEYQQVTPSIRSQELSSDFVPDYQVIISELQKFEKSMSETFHGVVLLQPTSPIRNPVTLQKCIEAILIDGYSSAWTVTPVPVKFHPRKQLSLQNESLKLVIESPLVIARQELDETLIRTGVCYAYTRKTALGDPKLLGSNARGIFCRWPFVNIDSLQDLKYAQEISERVGDRLVPRGEIV